MAITLKIAAATSLVLNRARQIVNGWAFQKIGNSFKDATICNATQSVGKTGTAKTRWAIRRPYTYTNAAGVVVSKTMFVNIEVTTDEDCPLTVVDEVPHLVQSVGAEPQFLAHVRDRIQPN